MDFSEKIHSLEQENNALRQQLLETQSQLTRYQERFELFSAGANDGIWEWDLITNELYNSLRWKETLGFYEDKNYEHSVVTWEKLVHPEDKEWVIQEIQKHLQGKSPFYSAEYRLKTQEGKYIWVVDRGKAIFSPTGEPLRMAGSIINITQRKEYEEIILEKEQRLRTVIRAMSEGILVLDRHGHFVATNPSFSRILGLTVDQIEGRQPIDPHWHVIHEDGTPYPGDTHPSWVTLKTGKPIHNDIQGVYDKTGRLNWILANSEPLRHQQTDELIGVVVTFTDITKQKKMQQDLHQERNFIRQVIDTIPNLIIVQDDTGDIILINEAADQIFVSQEALLNQINLFSDESLASSLSEAKGALCLQHPDGTPHYYQVLKKTFEGYESRRYVLSIYTDITLIKDAEDEMRRARDKAIESSRLKSDFLANMSHEIRTPMNGIIGMTELTLDTILTEEQREYLNTVRFSAQSLLSIINDILDFSKIEAGKYHLECIDFSLRHLMSEILKTLSLRVHNKGLALKIQIEENIPDVLSGDPLRLKQIITNLVDNAIKFTHQGGITISLSLLQSFKQEDMEIALRFAIQDTGIGIPPEKFNLIFESFSQADTSTTRQYGGTGLGLTICKRLVEAMQGKIWLESQQSQGTTFFFTVLLNFDVQKQDPNIVFNTAKKAIFTEKSKKCTILLVEDNLVNQKLATRLLQKLGHEIILAENGQVACNLFQTEQFDLILMDMQMPIMGGLEATIKIREWEKHYGGHVPIIAMTANAMQGDREKCLNAGMDDYLTKPIKIESLKEVLFMFSPTED